jgi:hypothetical protein
LRLTPIFTEAIAREPVKITTLSARMNRGHEAKENDPMRQSLALFLTFLIVLPAIAGTGHAPDDPVVGPAQWRERLRSAAQSREQQMQQVERLFHRDEVRNALHSAKLDARQVTLAAQLLSDDELARLSARSAAIERDIAAGALSNLMLTYIVIALCTAVIVLIAVN